MEVSTLDALKILEILKEKSELKNFMPKRLNYLDPT